MHGTYQRNSVAQRASACVCTAVSYEVKAVEYS